MINVNKQIWLLAMAMLFIMGCSGKSDIPNETIKEQVNNYFNSQAAIAGYSGLGNTVFFSHEFEVLDIVVVDKAIKKDEATIICKVQYKKKSGALGNLGSWDAGSFLPLITTKAAIHPGETGEGESHFTFKRFESGWRLVIPQPAGF